MAFKFIVCLAIIIFFLQESHKKSILEMQSSHQKTIEDLERKHQVKSH